MKHIAIILFNVSFLIPHSITASACTPKAAIVGESVWNIADRVQALLCGPISMIITQTNLPVTLDTPGLYCLKEDLQSSSTQTTPITITSSDVALDLRGHTIAKEVPTDGTRRAIIELANVDRIIISNGNLSACAPSSGTASGGIDALLSTTVSSFVITDLVTLTAENSGNVVGILLRFCSDCVLYQYQSFGTTIGLYLDQTTNCEFLECDMLRSTTAFYFYRIEDLQITDCNANGNGVGFEFGGSQTSNFNVIHEACTALNLTNGFLIPEESIASRIIYNECINQNMGNTGMSLQGTATSITYNKCIAQNCTSAGFEASSTSTAQFVTWLECKTVNNGAVGIDNVTTQTELNAYYSCYASGNPTQFTGAPAGSLKTLALINDGLTSFWHNFSST